MARPSWATPGQQRFLISNIPKFREAQKKKKLPEFRAELNAAFFQAYPFVGDTDGTSTTEDGGESDVEVMRAPNLEIARSVCSLFLKVLARDN